MKPKKPTTIAAAEKACRKAFKGIRVGRYVWCCHHERLYERLYESPTRRIDYILSDKPRREQLRRLNNFRPIKNVNAFLKAREYYRLINYREGEKMLMALYKKDVPFGTWSMTRVTILP